MSGRLAILWHLHQPDYRAPATGRPVMPWTRLHGLRGYRDLLVEVVEHGLPWTINVVPLLVDQLLYYAGGGDDRHLELTRREALGLDPREVAEAIDTLPGGHPAMTRAWPTWDALRARIASGERLDPNEIRDLQVWSTLCWFGATARRDFPVLRELTAKGRGFSETDKTDMLAVQDAILRDLPDRLRAVATTEGPSLSTSPYYHPILPLLVDVRHAARNLPHVPEELAFAFPEDARWHLTAARDRMEEVTGVRPIGLWPSEGSVSPEVVELAAEAGYRWLATDDRVLARSDHTISECPGGWDLGHRMRGFFRDQGLSDRIGFRYATWAPHDAARDLAAGVRERAGAGVLVIALDGENPWESFADAGGAFRDALRSAVPAAGLRWTTLDAAVDAPPVGKVRHLHTGSWVNADFRIWFGHAEDRAAWRALGEAREAAEQAPAERKAAAMPHLRAAEGSDWTWWYGDEFRTPWASTFDRIYRDHLAAAWRALGLEPPPSLDRPISPPHPPDRTEPQRWLDVSWEKATSGVPWTGAGTLRDWGAAGAMARSSDVAVLMYGWTRARPDDSEPDALWVHVEARSGLWAVERPSDGVEVQTTPSGLVARIAGPGPVTLLLRAADGSCWPGEPVVLGPPAHPSLAWWDV